MGDKIVVTIDADLEDIVPVFLATKEKDIKKMHDALLAGDYETIRLTGHSMKGSGGGYGFDTISEIGRRIEQASLAQNNNDIEDSIKELDSYLKRVEVEYE